MSEVTLYLGDCLEYMKTMPDKSVDAVITDPPYFIPAQHYQTRKIFKRNFSDLGILEYFFRNFFDEIGRILSDNGVFYIFCDGQSYPLFWFYGYQIARNVRPLIWDKGNSINGYSWRHQHELILFGEMLEAKPLPTGDGDILRCKPVPIETRKHPAEKPIELMAKLIAKCYGIIFDPFMGSASTAIACIELKKDFIGCESDHNYFTIAEKRIKQAQRQILLPIDIENGDINANKA